MSFFIKHRPETLEEMIGNDLVVSSVKDLLKKPDTPHSWLFRGNSGSGKTTIARIIAKHLKASGLGIIEKNVADIRGIEGIRDIISNCVHRIPGSISTVFILDEAHQLTKDAQNALLKVLEDPPPHVYFILATTEITKILPTIRTRCVEFEFKPLSDDEMLDLLFLVADKEGIELKKPFTGLILLVKASAGSPRMALNLLEKSALYLHDINKVGFLIHEVVICNSNGENDIANLIFRILVSSKSKVVAWTQIVNVLRRDVFSKNRAIESIKRGLINKLGQELLERGNIKISECILLLESSGSFYTTYSFVAVMYKFLDVYYGSID